MKPSSQLRYHKRCDDDCSSTNHHSTLTVLTSHVVILAVLEMALVLIVINVIQVIFL